VVSTSSNPPQRNLVLCCVLLQINSAAVTIIRKILIKIYLFIYKLKRNSFTLAVKNSAAASAAAEGQLGVTLIADVENLADVEIPDTAHQISTGAFLFLGYTLYTATELGIYENELIGEYLQIHGFRWVLCSRRASTARMCLDILGPSWYPWVGHGVLLV